MSQQKSVNTFENGMIKVDNPTKQPKNSYPFAFNAVINDIVIDKTSLTNEKSFELYYKPNGETNTNILGYIWLGLQEYILFIKNIEGETAYNKIIYLNQPKNEVRVIYDSLLLNFQDNYEIKGTYRINYKNQRIIYWVDGLNDDKVVNIDIDNTGLDISLLSIGESAKKPILTATVSDTLGSMTSGQYFIAMSYNIGESFTTSPYSISNPISIAKERYYNDITITPSICELFGDTDGDIIPIPTTKALQISIENLDNKFTSYNLYIIKYNVDGTYSIKNIERISITTDTYLYTGNEGTIDDSITINDIIVDTIKYYASEAIIQKENRLIRGNTKMKDNLINYQEFANNIKVTYEINEELVYNEDLFNNPNESLIFPQDFRVPMDFVHREHSISPSYLANTANDDYDNKGFMRDEVYSLGVGFELIDGTETPVYHIPGRIHNTLDNTLGFGEYNTTYSSVWDTQTVDGEVRWKSRNTAMDNGTLAYWRSDLTYSDGFNYPTNGETTSGKSYIRHHKMPSDVLEPIFRTEVTGDPNAVNTNCNFKLYKRNLSLNFSNIEIPEDIRDLVSKVKIFYTPRNAQNKRVISKGMVYDLYTDDDNIRQSQQPEGGADDPQDVFEFVSPDVSFKFKEINLQGSTFKINSVYKGYIQYIGNKGTVAEQNQHHYIRTYNHTIKNDFNRDQATLLPSICYLNSAVPKEEIYSRDIEKAFYVDNNFAGSTEGESLNFLGSQDTSFLRLEDTVKLKPIGEPSILSVYYPTLLYPSGSDTSRVVYEAMTVFDGDNPGNPVWQDKTFYETAYYVSLISSNNSLYGNIEDITYINSTNFIYDGADDFVSVHSNNGDTFIDMHHVKKTWVELVPPGTTPQPIAVDTTAQTSGDLYNDVYEFGSASFISFMCETDINIRMRRDGTGNQEKYFPKSFYSSHNIDAWHVSVLNPEYRQIEEPYKKAYLKLYFPNLTTQDIYNTDNTGIRYSTRIVYSDKQELEDKTDNYRIARANNYRDLPLNRGQITLFFIRQDKLYAITRDSLFNVFSSNQTIKSETADNIVIGTGEFLGLEPVELISIDGGYGGSSSKFSLVESPFGYLFVDRNKNKCFLFNEQLKDINILGLNENFKLELFKQFPQFESENGFDNPLTVGIIAIYDPELQRLLITKKDYKLLDVNTGTLTFVNGYVYRDGILLDYNNIFEFENKSFTASFDPINTKWISYHGYFPKNYLQHNTDFLVYNENNELIKSNGEGYDTEFIIETVFNENPLYTKVTDSLNINAESFDGDERTNDFFNELLVYNDQQSSDYLELNATNLTRKEKDWNVTKFFDKTKMQSRKPIFSKDWNNIKNNYYVDKVVNPLAIDVNKPWYQMARFRDKYVITRFSYNKNNMQKIIINFINTIYRISQR